MLHGDAETFLRQMGAKPRRLGELVHQVFVDLGCASYVKTIYIGYDLEGEMVGALYGHADRLEIALALPETADDALLVDASHLTWRTLPLAAVLRSEADMPAFIGLARAACERVRTRQHDVVRDNEHFIRSRRQRDGQ